MRTRPNQSAPPNRRSAERSDRSGNSSSIVVVHRPFPPRRCPIVLTPHDHATAIRRVTYAHATVSQPLTRVGKSSALAGSACGATAPDSPAIYTAKSAEEKDGMSQNKDEA